MQRKRTDYYKKKHYVGLQMWDDCPQYGDVCLALFSLAQLSREEEQESGRSLKDAHPSLAPCASNDSNEITNRSNFRLKIIAGGREEVVRQ